MTRHDLTMTSYLLCIILCNFYNLWWLHKTDSFVYGTFSGNKNCRELYIFEINLKQMI